MAGYELKMPKLGESVTEGTIGKWLKQPGDKVNKYDLLVEVQTDKVNTEIPSPVAGTLREVKVQEGATVPIGTLLAVFDTADGEAAAQPPAARPASVAATTSRAPSASPSSPLRRPSQQTAAAARSATAPPAEEHPDLSEVRATPAVRKLAAEHGIDISDLQGTGLGGRVSRKDVEDYVAGRSAQAGSVVTQQGPAPAHRQAAVATRASGPPLLAGDTPIPLTQM